MQRTVIGKTGIEVSEFCLGTMTFGTNTTEEEAHQQLDLSLDYGIDFLGLQTNLWVKKGG